MLVLLLGCSGDDEGPHDVVECGASWDAFAAGNPGATCERACVDRESDGGTGLQCNGAHPSGRSWACRNAFEYEDGVTGCCFPNTPIDPPTVEFFECAD